MIFSNNKMDIHPDVCGLNDDGCCTPNQPYDVVEGSCDYDGE